MTVEWIAMKRLAYVLSSAFLALSYAGALQAQTIGLNQTVIADFNSVSEFQSLSSQGWIFRPGSGTGTSTCATPGDIASCGFGFATDGAAGVARAAALNNPAGRWIITPQIVFGSSGSVTLVLRKAAPGQGGIDVRESGGTSDTEDMLEGIDAISRSSERGTAPCPAGTGSFCPERTVRTSGSAASGGEPSCANLFSAGNTGVGLSYCTVVIPASDLQNFGTGLHRLAFKMRSAAAAGNNNQDMLIDRIEIRTGNNDTAPIGAYLFSDLGPPLGFLRHPIAEYNTGVIQTLGPQAAFNGMDFSPTGVLYGVTSGSPQQLHTINAATGVSQLVANLSGFLRSDEFTQDLTIDPLTGLAYAIGRNFTDLQSRLYFLNLTTGELSLQAGINNGNEFKASAFAMDCQSRLFAIDTTTAGTSRRLFRIDRVNGNVTLIGNTGYVSTIQHGAIDFDNATGRLYGWVQLQSGAMHGYGSYSLNNGFFSVIGSSPQLNASAGAINSQCWASFRSGFEG
jgi:hypothetical protein